MIKIEEVCFGPEGIQIKGLYAGLDGIPLQTERREVIRNMLKRGKLAEILYGVFTESIKILDDESVPARDKRISLNFAVGGKYKRDEPYSADETGCYVLGIVDSKEEKQLLVLELDDKVGCLPRDWMRDPNF